MLNKKSAQKIIVAAALLVGLFLAGTSQTMAQTSTIVGEWDAVMNTPGGTSNFKIVFKVEGEKLTGTVKRSRGDATLEGTIKGNDINFTYVVKYGENDLVISMTGKLDGDTIKGVVTFGESTQEEWSAKRAAPVKQT